MSMAPLALPTEVIEMLLIKCPWCGKREQTEFSYGGEADISRPLDPDSLSDQEWADYLFYRNNPKGLHKELWAHSAGCRQWFKATRDTVTYLISETSRIDSDDTE